MVHICRCILHTGPYLFQDVLKLDIDPTTFGDALYVPGVGIFTMHTSFHCDTRDAFH
jgi:hypothetical protein